MKLTDRDWLLEELPEHVDYWWLVRLINAWVEAESLPFKMGVLSTVDEQGFPKSRTVAIREINEQGLIFFTQLGSAKVRHISVNPNVSFTFMLPNTQRQITVSGRINPLDEIENVKNWETYDQERRLRFLVYGTKSGQTIKQQHELDEELVILREKYKKTLPERPREYVGYTIVPKEIKFYQLNEHRISDSLKATCIHESWILQRFVP
ncbi:pyridoxamine 5'-phosphate oxidase [Legionella sp. km535]|uniref:pyridoxamine 5'-phosphate oxidase family protein n=1 Tax=Legionella sp. km535 TaxID=2498107 RepID=UPI000F8D466E|nr:pyridoxamine 5'-phosphate oxidase family protein [Legionella sp. km535]RUR19622.1 pyridoxamine 5'-phosphate oxidase [Legionella sp. km535]